MPHQPATIGVLVSGGLDSAILTAHLLEQGQSVQPIYVDSQLFWQPAELAALRRFLAAIAQPRLADLVVLSQPLDDLYQNHWSLTGTDVPGETTPDEAVYLPGRNLLLAIKPALWCQMHGIHQLSLGVLASNPFDDASDGFFSSLESTLAKLGQMPLHFVRPLATMHKREVMRLGTRLPLHLTFSCIAPVDGRHCGHCNKCAERKAAFDSAGIEDETTYAERVGVQRSNVE